MKIYGNFKKMNRNRGENPQKSPSEEKISSFVGAKSKSLAMCAYLSVLEKHKNLGKK